jgi:hypothetical protein
MDEGTYVNSPKVSVSSPASTGSAQSFPQRLLQNMCALVLHCITGPSSPICTWMSLVVMASIRSTHVSTRSASVNA